MKKGNSRLLGVALTVVMLALMLGAFAISSSAVVLEPETTVIDGKTFYQISSPSDMHWFMSEVNDNDEKDINGILTANIDLSSICSETLGSWDPINHYGGIFDGNGYEISGLYCNGNEKGGLFGMVYDSDAVIKNVTVRGYVSGSVYVGGIVGYLYTNGATVKNCVNYATIEVIGSEDAYVGGIVGYSIADGEGIVDCINYGTVSGTPTNSSADYEIGGIVGGAGSRTTVSGCENHGIVRAGTSDAPCSAGGVSLGGIVGYTRGVVSNCYSGGDIYYYGSVKNQDIGGIAGNANNAINIESCFVDAELIADENSYIGSLIGDLTGSRVVNCGWNSDKSSYPAYERSYNPGISASEGYSESALSSGAVAYGLGEAWGQEIGVDPAPVLGGMKVYKHLSADVLCTEIEHATFVYTNSETHGTSKIVHDSTVGPDAFDSGVCKNCGYVCEHTSVLPSYTSDEDGHTALYSCCGMTVTTSHDFTNGECICGTNDTPAASDFDVVLPGNGEIKYSGSAVTAEVTAKPEIIGMGAITIKYYKNGESVSEPTSAGVYSVRIDVTEGEGYNAATDLEVGVITILPKTIKETDVIGLDRVIYNGLEQKPSVTINGLDPDADYGVSWDKEGFVNAGTYTVTVTGKGNYDGTVTKTYEIAPRPIGDDDVDMDITEVTYDKEAHIPVISIDGLTAGTDYTVSWDKEGFVNAGTYTATISCIGNYVGTVTREFTVKKAEIEIELLSPVSAALPGNQIALVLNTNTDATPTWTVVNGVHISDNKIKVNDGLTIGEDKVTVTVSFAEGNYTAGTESVTLDVGMSDFSGEISALEERIDALDEIYATDDALRAEIDALKNSVTDLANADTKTAEEISDLTDRITAIENAYAAKSDLDAAVARLDGLTRDGGTLDQINAEIKKINDALVVLDAENRLTLAEKALDTLVNTTVPGLNELISDNAENISANAADIAVLKNNVKDINSTLLALDAEDERLAQLISGLDSELLALSDALSALTDRVDVAEKNIDALEGAVAELDAALKKDAQDLKDAIDALNTAIDNARSALEKADADNKKILEKAIADAKTNLDYAIEQVAKALEKTDKRLSDAIAKGDSDLSDRINALKAELDAAISAYKAADESMKEELSLKIESADKTLDEAIKAVQKNLDDAKAELEGAIAELDAAVKKGDADLKAEIAAVNSALANARSALEKADADNKAELTAALDSAEKALTAAIEAVQKNLSDTKAELEKVMSDNKAALDARDSDLNTFIIIVCVISSLSLAGTATFVIWFFVSKKR